MLIGWQLARVDPHCQGCWCVCAVAHRTLVRVLSLCVERQDPSDLRTVFGRTAGILARLARVLGHELDVIID